MEAHRLHLMQEHRETLWGVNMRWLSDLLLILLIVLPHSTNILNDQFLFYYNLFIVLSYSKDNLYIPDCTLSTYLIYLFISLINKIYVKANRNNRLRHILQTLLHNEFLLQANSLHDNMVSINLEK